MEPGMGTSVKTTWMSLRSEYPYCFVSVSGFNNLKARILDRSDGTQTNQWFIFDDEDRRCF
jgi:hypothetical protein